MKNKIKQEAKKEAEQLWENDFKKSFQDKLNNYFMDELKGLKKNFKVREESMFNYINSLDKKLEDKFNLQVSKLQQQKSFNQDFNLFNNNEEIKEEDESDDQLRKKDINLKSITNPPLKKIIPPENSNSLINLLLNCIINIRSLIAYYLNREKENKIMRKPNGNPNILGPAFLKLLDHTWKSKYNQYIPNEIHQIMKNLMKDMYDTQNPGLIFQLFLTQLNNELSQDQLNKNDNLQEDPYIIFNRDKLLEKFKMQNNQNTKIQNCFYNIIETEKRCKSCETVSYSLEYFPIINIYLHAHEIDIYNKLSFLEHFKTLLIDKNEEKINENCIICDGKTEKYVSKHILDTNQVIIININRHNDPNNIVEFNFPEIIEKKDFINLNKAEKYYEFKYEIFCVLKKYKINNNYQYILFCKNFINNTWYSYNNQDIRKSELKEAMSDSKNACLIIYEIKY